MQSIYKQLYPIYTGQKIRTIKIYSITESDNRGPWKIAVFVTRCVLTPVFESEIPVTAHEMNILSETLSAVRRSLRGT